MESTDADDDYDDFHEDLDESTEFSRNYVPLNASVPASANGEARACFCGKERRAQRCRKTAVPGP